MWYSWTTLLLVSCALVEAAEVQSEIQGEVKAEAQAVTEPPGPVATTRAPARTLDRQAAELAWRSWLQSPESGNQNAPPRRITTKSLFITPLVCPKGQRLDRNGCAQVVTVDKDEHERILLEHLNALFTSAPGGSDVQYDYGDEEPGPLQLSIPIGYDAQASPLQSPDHTDTGQDYVKIDKKGENTQNNDASIEAELELLKLQQSHDSNNTTGLKGANIVSHNALSNFLAYPDKPKRDSPMTNSSEIQSLNSTEVGQKEEVFGHVSVDPIMYDTSFQNQQPIQAEPENINLSKSPLTDTNLTNISNTTQTMNNSDSTYNTTKQISTQVLKTVSDNSKLNPEHDYSDIGEAIKLISRYAEVTTDDNFSKDKNNSSKEDNILGTRTKLQYRRNKPKQKDTVAAESVKIQEQGSSDEKPPKYQSNLYFRYSWPNEHVRSAPLNYPFKHLQDYWPGQKHVGGVYATHENPRRHHHTYPHNYLRPHGYPYAGNPQLYPRLQETYSGLHRYPHRVARHNASPIRSHANNQDLYSLLGLRHWFSSEGTSKR